MYNFPASLSDWTMHHWLRIIVIVGCYLIIRPYLVQIGERIQKKQLEEGTIAGKLKKEQEEKKKKREKEEAKASGSGGWGWGKGARKRQQKKKSDAEKRAEIIAAMESDDDDVSDLLPTPKVVELGADEEVADSKPEAKIEELD